MANSSSGIVPAVRQGIVDIISPGVVVDLAAGEWMGSGNRVLPAAELEKFVLDYAAMIAGNAPLTIVAVKRSLIEMPKDYLGHKNIQHTVRYTELAPDRFKNFWRD